jgi:hypothetical protein
VLFGFIVVVYGGFVWGLQALFQYDALAWPCLMWLKAHSAQVWSLLIELLPWKQGQ